MKNSQFKNYSIFVISFLLPHIDVIYNHYNITLMAKLSKIIIMKRAFFLISIFLGISIVSVCAQTSDKKLHIRTVVIDAGHGGHDPGAVGSKYKEKDIALAIALKLGKYIEDNLPDVKVVYTRKTDVFVELHKRAEIANKNKADLFISIHCNAAKNKAAYGSETFVMGLHRSQENLEVAKKENAAILLEDNYSEIYEGFDPNSPESNIIFSLFQNVYLDNSLLVAQKVQDQFKNRVGLEDRGVKQAGFWVLYKVAATGILIEVGFISNAKEEEFLGSEKGQNYIASAIFRAFRDFKYKIEGKPATNVEPQLDKINEIVLVNEPKEPEIIVHHEPETIQTETGIRYRVQFTTSSQSKSIDSKEFEALKDVKMYFLNGLYRYTSGDFSSPEEANAWRKKVQEKGFKDAFVVTFHNDKRISREEANKILNQ